MSDMSHRGSTAPAVKPRKSGVYKRWLKRILLTAAVCLLLLLGFAAWILNTEAGARFAFRFLPSELTVGGISGTFASSIKVNKLAFKVAGTEITLVNGKITSRWRQLLTNQIAIDELELDGLRVILSDVPGGATKANSGARNPLLLLRNLKLSNVLVEKNGVLLTQIDSASASTLSLRGERFEFDDLRIDEQRATLIASGALDFSGKTQSALKFAINHRAPAIKASGSLSGTPKKLTFNAALDAPNVMTVSGELTDALSPQMRWNATVAATDLALAQYGIEAPVQTVSAGLSGSGSLRSVNLRGSLGLDQDVFDVRDLDIEMLDGNTLKINALKLGLPGDGVFSAKGVWPLATPASASASAATLDAATPSTATPSTATPSTATVGTGKLELNWSKFSLPARFGWPAGLASTRGSISVVGELNNFQADIDLALQRAQPALSGNLRGKVSRQLSEGVDQFSFAPLQIENSDGGTLVATGDVSVPVAADGTRRSSELSWTLDLIADKLNPALFAKNWPGSIGLKGQTTGKLIAGKPSAELEINALSGTLKQQALSGQGALKFANSFTPTGTLALRWGVNAVDFSANQTGDVQANIDIADLGALVPDAGGSVQGGVTLRQAKVAKKAATFTLEGALSARLLRFNGVSADTLEITAEVPSNVSAPIALTLKAADVELAGQRIRQANLTIAGTRAQHQVNASISSEQGAIALAALGGLVTQRQATAWQGQLNALTLTPILNPDKTPSSLKLQAPVNLRVAPEALALERACFDGIGVAFCGVLDWAKVGVSKVNVELIKLDLAELHQAFATAEGTRMTGVIGGQISAEMRDGTLTALNASIAPTAGSALKLTLVRLDSDDVELEISDFGLTAASAAGAPPMVNLQLSVKDAGSIKASNLVLRGGELGGTLEFDLSSLKAFDGVSESIINPNGQVKGALTLSGSTSQPNIRGKITLSELALELPAAGLKLKAGAIEINSDGDRLNVEGSIRSGAGGVNATASDGVLNVSGWLAPFASAKAELKLQGTKVLLTDTPSVRVVASPDLLVVHNGKLIKVTGALVLPSAKLQLDRFESNVTRSADVVVIDDAKQTPGTPVQADVTVTLGDDVSLKGFGLNGKLSGRLRIRERANKAATARGAIEVKGTYKAYGQDLLIERGKLLFSSTPLDDPGLDIRAVRKINSIRAGVQVRGTALRPELTVWSVPVLEQSDALSYIVLGRSLRGSGADSALVGQAANSLRTAGGNLLARGLGQRVGLELGVETLSDIGGPAFTAGKYLSPALYVGYGKSLFNAQTLFILRYKLFERYELEALSGREQKIGINYRRER